MMLVCPYCLNRPCDSNDHIFPEFLGGKATVGACKQCNSAFGHDFESTVAHSIGPLIVLLARSGYEHHRRVVFREAWVDDKTGQSYDLDSRGIASLSRPIISRDGCKITRIVGASRKHIKGALKGATKDPKFIGLREWHERKEVPIPDMQFRLRIDNSTQRLAMKMCVGLVRRLLPEVTLLDNERRNYLLGHGDGKSFVRSMRVHSSVLDSHRAELAHVIYVEGDPNTSRLYGMVQFFGGAVRFYVDYGPAYGGPAFAALGSLDIKTFAEELRLVTPLSAPEAPVAISEVDDRDYWARWEEVFSAQITKAYGRAVIRLSARRDPGKGAEDA